MVVNHKKLFTIGWADECVWRKSFIFAISLKIFYFVLMENNDYIYTLEIAVRDYELDSEGIVNNANYLHYLEMTRHEFCRWAGYSFKEMSADGIVPVLSRVEIDYKTPLRSGDVMLSSLWVEKRGVRFVFHQDIRNKFTGEMAVSAVVTVVSLEGGRLSRGDRLFERFEKWL